MSLKFLIYYITIILFIFISVAFYTLMERKILSYHQNRKGPNMISILGWAQPISDALKLLSKEEMNLSNSNLILYWTSPFYSFLLFLLVMIIWIGGPEMNYSLFVFFCLISIMAYGVISSGWSSNSKFSLLGSLRSLAQSISYEVILILSLLLFSAMAKTLDLQQMIWSQKFNFCLFFFLPVFLILSFSLVCEVNRSPSDLSEGESELVSGFNTEYGGTKFAMIFLAEYGMMMIMSLILSAVSGNFNLSIIFIKTGFFMALFIWLRSSMPRIRYDMLMSVNWKHLLNFTLLISIFFISIL